MRSAIVIGTVAGCVMAAAGQAAGEKIVLRATDGRFLSVAKDGSVRAAAHLPGENETFELIPQGADRAAFRASGGRLLVAAGADGRRLRAEGGRGQPGPHEVFVLVPAGENRVGLKSSAGRWVRAEAKEPKPGDLPPPVSDKPSPGDVLEVYGSSEIPAALQMPLGAAVDALVKKELEGKEYDKTRSELKVRYVELPAPTLRDPRRMKKHRLWATRHEYRVQARLDGQPQIRVTGMPCLKSYAGPEKRLLMFAAEAEIPVVGRVEYRIPERVSASTGYRTTAALRVVGEVRVEKSDDRLNLASPEVLDVHVELRRLDISNDLLNLAADPIEDVINGELRDQHERILEESNKAIRKAFDGGEFRHPLLHYVSLP